MNDITDKYAADSRTAAEAQRLAQEIAFAPVVFQVSRLMVRFGIFQLLLDGDAEGLTLDEVAEKSSLSRYAAQVLLESSVTAGTVLLESSVTAGTVLLRGERYRIAKAGYFLLTDPMTRANMNFIHDVNYLGLFDLEASLLKGRPEGLKVFGGWPTIYEGLSSLPEGVRESWFGFDHFYSDGSFGRALDIVFGGGDPPRRLLDVGGNTGRWAARCVERSPDVEVTIMDLPQQLGLMRAAVEGMAGAERIHGHATDLLDEAAPFPRGFDAIWMSQFLDCFSEEQVTGILRRAAASMTAGARLYIMETFWDRQRYETAAYCLAQTSLYFTALANGNSKMYRSRDMARCVAAAGLETETIHDDLGLGHSIMVCKRSE